MKGLLRFSPTDCFIAVFTYEKKWCVSKNVVEGMSTYPNQVENNAKVETFLKDCWKYWEEI